MAVSNKVVSMVRVLAIVHIVVGALLIIFGIADGVTSVFSYGDGNFFTGQIFFGVWIGTWISVHCRNSASVRYNLTHFSPSQPVFSLAFLPTRSSR